MAGWILQSNDDAPRVLRLTPGTARTIGRGAQADFVFEAPLVSRVHCRLTADKSGQLIVEDLESTNGTHVNGKRVKRAVAKAGDEIGVGKVTIRIEQHAR